MGEAETEVTSPCRTAHALAATARLLTFSLFINQCLRASSLTPVGTLLHHCYLKNAATSPAAILKEHSRGGHCAAL